MAEHGSAVASDTEIPAPGLWGALPPRHTPASQGDHGHFLATVVLHHTLQMIRLAAPAVIAARTLACRTRETDKWVQIYTAAALGA